MKRLTALLVAGLLLIGAGCGHPSAANIQLRKDKQQLEGKLDQTQRELGAARASIRALESHATTVPILPEAQLDKLFTTHALHMGNGTGEAEIQSGNPTIRGLKVYAVPVDQYNQPIKAAGSFTVDAFDLAIQGDNRIGHWEFPIEKAQENFRSMLLLYTYVLNCPWQQPPKHTQITVRVTFNDALTHRTFTAQKVVQVTPPPTTLPSAGAH